MKELLIKFSKWAGSIVCFLIGIISLIVGQFGIAIPLLIISALLFPQWKDIRERKLPFLKMEYMTIYIIISLYMICILFYLNKYKTIKTEKTAVVKEDIENISNKVTIKNKLECFTNIEKTISILSNNGIGELSKWEDINAKWGDENGITQWSSMSDYYAFDRTDKYSLPNNICYSLDGDETSISSITIHANLNIPSKNKTGKKFITKIVIKTLKSLDISIPDQLIKSIKNEKPININLTDYIISLEITKNNIGKTYDVNIISK